jgi:hypothetical protein
MPEDDSNQSVASPEIVAIFQPAGAFVPRRGLRGGHAQTIAGNFLGRPSRLPEAEQRLFTVDTDVQLLCHCNWQPERQKRLTLVIVHGLEGSSRSGYVLGTGGRAWQRGWNVVRMNIRGCGGTEHLSATLYHSGLSQDIEALVRSMIDFEGLERVALVGFSMGGNQVLRAVGRWGATRPPQVVAAAAVSPACDLALSADRIHAPSNRIYEWWFMRSLRASYRRKAAQWPGRYDLDRLRGAWSLRGFDENITSHYMGFAGADDYYNKASSSHVLQQIGIPTLVIHADDDPFIVLSPATRQKLADNPQITFLPTAHGGHCAFLAEARNGDDGRWAERRVVEFLSAVEVGG